MDTFKEVEFVDLGHWENNPADNYPEVAHKVAAAVSQDKGSLGVLICGSGLGMSMAANKHQGIRAAVATSPQMAHLARQHNDANILTLGGRLTDQDTAAQALREFMETEFEGGRHEPRVKSIEPD